MMKFKILKIYLYCLAALPSLSLAHPGHDHQSPWAGLIHLAWIAPLIIALAVIVFKMKKSSKQ
ncbi:hypothetical protein N7931_18650 [Catenovulum sp. 2E275]|uniref:hypothetical protein n=1 Tax=Catenovulum sp. 2E275 TaxID=2980497 RepID=UPI0021D37471|nr:hypothetical protein [Catenovulum sp. 2E275]MCU4677639.1 hypothetical protein [Catenovulum sp. 2E275]